MTRNIHPAMKLFSVRDKIEILKRKKAEMEDQIYILECELEYER